MPTGIGMEKKMIRGRRKGGFGQMVPGVLRVKREAHFRWLVCLLAQNNSRVWLDEIVENFLIIGYNWGSEKVDRFSGRIQ